MIFVIPLAGQRSVCVHVGFICTRFMTSLVKPLGTLPKIFVSVDNTLYHMIISHHVRKYLPADIFFADYSSTLKTKLNTFFMVNRSP